MLRLDYIPLSFRDRISPYFGSFPCLFGRPSIYDQSDCQSQLGWVEHVWLSRRMRLQPKRRIFLAQSIAGRHALQNFELLHETRNARKNAWVSCFVKSYARPLLPIDASPAKAGLWMGGRAERESRASSLKYTKRLHKTSPSSFHSPLPGDHPPVPSLSPLCFLSFEPLFTSFLSTPFSTR